MKYFTKNHDFDRHVYKEYIKEYNKNFPVKPPFMEFINTMHDADITWCERIGDDIVLRVDSQNWADYDIVLKNATVLKQDFEVTELGGSGWLYHELYPSKSGYELHVLFHTYSADMFEFIFDCENIEIREKTDYAQMRVIANEKNRELLFARLESLCEKYGFKYAVHQNEPYRKIDGQFEMQIEFGPCQIFTFDEWSEIFEFLFRTDFIIQPDYESMRCLCHFTGEGETDSFFVIFGIPPRCIIQ